MENVFLSDKQLGARYDTSRSTIWRWVRNGDFPEPVKLSPGCTRWALETVAAWERKRLGKAH